MTMKKLYMLGTQEEHTHTGRKVQAKVFCRAQVTDGKLSIVGVIGPLSNGDCHGNCCQCQDSIKIEHYADGWNADLVRQFLDLWKRWHLNDMRPNCEHQTAANGFDTARSVKIYEFALTSEALAKQRAIKDATQKSLVENGSAEIDEEDRHILGLPYSYKSHEDFTSSFYTHRKTETKTLGWLHENEHPQGCLGKACPTCGYKYGTKWLKEELPQEVAAFLESLPAAQEACPWSNL